MSAVLDAHVMATYARYPLTLERGEGMRVRDEQGRWFLDFAGAESRDARNDETAARIAELERQIAELQGVCDARQKVIDELDQAARERLALVERLHGECAALQERLAGGSRRR